MCASVADAGGVLLADLRLEHEDVGEHLAHDARVAGADLRVDVDVVAVVQRADEAVGGLDVDADGARGAADRDRGGGLAGRDEDRARDLLAGEEILLEDGVVEAGGGDQDAGELVVLDDFLLNQVAACKDVLRRACRPARRRGLRTP